MQTLSITNNTAQFKHTRSSKNVRANRPAPTQHPFHTFKQRIKINAEPSLLYIMYLNSTWKWDCDLILYQSPITHVKFKQCKRTLCCSSRTNTTPVPYIHRTNEDQYSVYTRGWDYDLKLHWSPITSPNASTHCLSNATNVRAVCAEPPNTTAVTSDEDQRRAVITISMYLDSAWRWVYDFILRWTRHCSVYVDGWDNDFILRWLRWTPITPHTQQWMLQTYALFVQGQHDSHPRSRYWTNNDERGADIGIIVVNLNSACTWDYDFTLPPSTI